LAESVVLRRRPEAVEESFAVVLLLIAMSVLETVVEELNR